MASERQEKVKKLPPTIQRDFDSKNRARKSAFLSPLSITVRSCLICGKKFESVGNRLCGCVPRSMMSFAGRDVLQ